jgi:4-diphosphocytidyl-2-C-methyl-D-erythritol kinase
MAIEAFAPAKLNLSLHVTGRRADGYHLLDSLVAFADVGDRIRVERADRTSLTVTGPQAAGLSAGDDNLVLRAARLMPQAPARITLDKVLPVASGIGGGSADAAATLRALAGLHGLPLPQAQAVLGLGADVPVCLEGRACRMTGVGEGVTPLAQPLPEVAVVLVNPGVALATPSVFAALDRRDNPPMPHVLPPLRDLPALVAFLRRTRNDLEPPAIRLAPVIARVRAALAAQPGCALARMSGSGATCFGLFADDAGAMAAAAALRRAEPGWWVAAARLRDQATRATT